jgi:ribulose-phosphate 3-epimerase
VAINPATPLSAIYDVVELIDTVLLMTVNPVLAAKIHSQSTAKIRQLREFIDRQQLPTAIQVDGGIRARHASDGSSSRRQVMPWSAVRSSPTATSPTPWQHYNSS